MSDSWNVWWRESSWGAQPAAPLCVPCGRTGAGAAEIRHRQGSVQLSSSLQGNTTPPASDAQPQLARKPQMCWVRQKCVSNC